ncbi:hypothetical protein Tco_0266041 [Tanacetum coccineum]
MSKSTKHAQTPANSVVWNIAGKGSKQETDGDPGYLPEDKLREVCKKHYNQIPPIMAEQRRLMKKRKPSPVTASKDTRLSHSASVFSRLRREGTKPARRRIPISTTIERQREIKIEWDAADRANRIQPARTEKTYLSENEHDQGGHWKSKKQRSTNEEDLSQSWLCEETDPFTARIRNFEVPKRTCIPTNVKTYDGTGDPEDHLKIFQTAAKSSDGPCPRGAICLTPH